jgi:diacylglycerol kinase (ATP)
MARYSRRWPGSAWTLPSSARPTRSPSGWPAYAVAATGQLARRPVTFTIRLDDGEPLTRQALCITVGNSGALPGGFGIMPDAVVDDGWLDVVVLAPHGPLGWADVGFRVALRSRRDNAQLERLRARTVEICTAGPALGLPRQVDGELIGPSNALTVRVLPGALLIRVPTANERG